MTGSIDESVGYQGGYKGLQLLVYVPLAQLDKACGYEPQDREFESLRGCHYNRIKRGVIMLIVGPCSLESYEKGKETEEEGS